MITLNLPGVCDSVEPPWGLGCCLPVSQPVVRDKDTTYEALYRIPCDPLTVKPCACMKQCVALANISFTPDRQCTSEPIYVALAPVRQREGQQRLWRSDTRCRSQEGSAWDGCIGSVTRTQLLFLSL